MIGIVVQFHLAFQLLTTHLHLVGCSMNSCSTLNADCAIGLVGEKGLDVLEDCV